MPNTYKITFKMSSPIHAQGDIMFDSIIAYCWTQEHGTEFQKSTGQTSFDELIDFSVIPITMHKDGYHIASWMLYEGHNAVEQVNTLLKKWDEEHDFMAGFKGGKRKVAIDRGEFKTTQIPLRTIAVPEVWFYFQSDNPELVAKLVTDHLPGIGKKTRRGGGNYKSFTIEQCDNVFETQILRPIPVNDDYVHDMIEAAKTSEQNIKVQYRAWKIPYWLPENFTHCRVQ